MPKISILMPIYNAEHYLEKSVRSLLSQTFTDFEVICINDGSKDSSLEILEKLKQEDSRIKIISKENSGYGATMNIGLEEVQGDYIAILEPDDFILKGMLETLYNVAIENDVDFVKSDYYEFTGEEIDFKKTYKKLTYTSSYYNKVINPQEDINVFNFAMNTWTGLYKTSFIQENNIRYNESAGASFQDNGFWFQTFCHATKVYFLNKAFYLYRQDNPNSSINNKNKIFNMCDEYYFIGKFLNNRPELKKKFKYIYQQRRFKNYKFSYKKIDDKFKDEFLERFKNDFKKAIKDREIDVKLFRKDELMELFLIVTAPKLYKILYK